MQASKDKYNQLKKEIESLQNNNKKLFDNNQNEINQFKAKNKDIIIKDKKIASKVDNLSADDPRLKQKIESLTKDINEIKKGQLFSDYNNNHIEKVDQKSDLSDDKTALSFEIKLLYDKSTDAHLQWYEQLQKDISLFAIKKLIQKNKEDKKEIQDKIKLLRKKVNLAAFDKEYFIDETKIINDAEKHEKNLIVKIGIDIKKEEKEDLNDLNEKLNNLNEKLDEQVDESKRYLQKLEEKINNKEKEITEKFKTKIEEIEELTKQLLEVKKDDKISQKLINDIQPQIDKIKASQEVDQKTFETLIDFEKKLQELLDTENEKKQKEEELKK